MKTFPKTPYFLMIFALGFGSSASAVLGEHESSITGEHSKKMRASAVARNAGSRFTTHQMEIPGNSIKYHSDPNGIIFGISWHGTGHGHLPELLGKHYQTFTSESGKPDSIRLSIPRKAVVIRSDNMVLSIVGNQRSQSGFVYLPMRKPSNVDPEEIK